MEATIWQHINEKGVLRHNSSRPLKDQSGAWRNGTSFGLNDFEAIMNSVAGEAKERISALAFTR